uniref:Mucin 2, oligomeric mucus/gel-forming n=1 Tax=Varanus komodoensis TaxID=61221 RepID=A0A8D2KTK7_VARKO
MLNVALKACFSIKPPSLSVFQNTELKFEGTKIEKFVLNNRSDVTHLIRERVGLYIVVESSNGIVLIWDKKTTIIIKLTPRYQGKVCGLCGNFDGKASNDFTTRSMVQVNDALAFGNSWKMDPACPDVEVNIEPCEVRPHRRSWAEKECSLIKSESFKTCHYKVNPEPYYEACVHDSCACDSGGDCDCFCAAVAVYAQECIKAGACVSWRTPERCPIFCEYYNPSPEECTWHYEACGRDITTCQVLGQVATNFTLPYLEGKKHRCPTDRRGLVSMEHYSSPSAMVPLRTSHGQGADLTKQSCPGRSSLILSLQSVGDH